MSATQILTATPAQSITDYGVDTDPQRRIAAVADLEILDRIGDPVLTALTRLAATITGAPAAAVHVFDEEYQRRIAAFGVPMVDIPQQDSFCRLVVLSGTRIVTRDASLDERFSYSPYARDPKAPVRFYASVPLTVGGGVAVGTLCAFDTEPREIDDEQIKRLEDIADVARAHLELSRVAAEFGSAATRDALTGAYNRGVFEARLTQALARHRRRGTPLVVALIDFDDFKQINDNHGHARGDGALQWVARKLQDGMREEDTVGRLGGDEFGIVAEAGEADLETLVALINGSPAGFEPKFGLSVGAVLAEHGDSVESVLQRADEAMYAIKRAKRVGR